ncbi:4-alpha-glucanotransferase [Methylomagnum ishizawai]|uniref:4-alpha-glucanotransferase n=1 Tax=Methylomagnum ishizawai TaxID=1760988 RepID=UPI001C3276C0|nr:4-alpha-glucanotransferase [Methylomagnum ishizawai]BBL76408.1 4-alpha-glucanotransferase [Methylomagnum ishizawai]
MTQAHSILDRRRAGVLLHITSLPGLPDNGDLGAHAYRFVDFLADHGVTVWQTLPIGPTHPDGSPYQCLSAHAGNPWMIDLEWLLRRGWLDEADIAAAWTAPDPTGHRGQCLAKAYGRFAQLPADNEHRQAYRRFYAAQAGWLADYALFIALRQELKHRPWQDWPIALRDREPAALDEARRRLAEGVGRVGFEQFVFFQQWGELRDYAKRRGVLLFGDMPIFIASDSADVWAQREYFDLREDGQARVVAGVPPDYFSATGQRWGNPHYLWARMAEDGFRWWLDRIRSQLALYDWVRIDHFRGFEAYWEIPAESETAMHGRWVEAPGAALLDTVFATLDGAGLPLVAENLGIITPEVEALRNRFDIPGMLILQFAFDGGPDNPYLPHNHTPNNVVYTGTHDNDTTLSWFEGLSEAQRAHVYEYLGQSNLKMPWALAQSALASVAKLAILPMQDILEQGKGYRMNTPGTMDDTNWRWRFRWDQLQEEQGAELARLIHLYGRHPEA